MGDVVESDWKLFRKRLPQWQEDYMARLEREYIAILSGEGQPSEKFWALEERIERDKKCPGVVIEGTRRSMMHAHIVQLVLRGVITMRDLDGFSEDVTGYVQQCLKWRK